MNGSVYIGLRSWLSTSSRRCIARLSIHALNKEPLDGSYYHAGLRRFKPQGC